MKIGYQTDIGQRRKSNQDAVGIFENLKELKLAIVADGMGGHQAGDIASQQAVADIGSLWESTALHDEEAIIQWLLQVIQKENEVIYERGQSDASKMGMGTTIVATVLLTNRKLVLAHVGDSRSYLIRQSGLRQLTEDHSLVNELVKSGELTPEMAKSHPRKNVLVRSLGIPGVVEVDVTTIETEIGDKVLLCSDGLTNMLSDEELLTVITQPLLPEKIVQQLIEKANEAGGTDNITVLLIEISEKEDEARD